VTTTVFTGWVWVVVTGPVVVDCVVTVTGCVTTVPGAGGGGEDTTWESGSDEQPATNAMAPINPIARVRAAGRAGIFVVTFMLRARTDSQSAGSFARGQRQW
jgi:hypothetical protein